MFVPLFQGNGEMQANLSSFRYEIFCGESDEYYYLADDKSSENLMKIKDYFKVLKMIRESAKLTGDCEIELLVRELKDPQEVNIPWEEKNWQKTTIFIINS